MNELKKSNLLRISNRGSMMLCESAPTGIEIKVIKALKNYDKEIKLTNISMLIVMLVFSHVRIRILAFNSFKR